MVVPQLCARTAFRQAIRAATRPSQTILCPAASNITPDTERSNSTYNTSTSAPSQETPLSVASQSFASHGPQSHTRSFLSHFQRQASGPLLPCRPSRSPELGSAFCPQGFSFSTNAFLASPSSSSSEQGPQSPLNQTVDHTASGRDTDPAHQPNDFNHQRPPFRRRQGSHGAQNVGEVPSGARQLATDAVAQTESLVGPAAGASVGVGKQTKALPPLPPRKKVKALRKTAQHIMNILDQEAVAELKQKKNYPEFRAGDVLELDLIVPENRRRTAVVRGVCIARRNRGMGSTFVIRRVVAGEGMEYTYPLYSPNIQEIKIIERRPVRRAKLFYLREWNPRECTV